MQPRQRYLAALAGQMPDRVPFVIWNIIVKSTVYRLTTPGIETKTEQLESKDGLPRTKKVYHTPAGTLSTTLRLYPGSTWLEKMPFTGPEDYEPLEAFIRSKTYPPCYDDFLKDDRKYADQSIARPETIYTPIQDLICKYMGVEAFCIEWSDRRDRLLKLYDVIAQDRRKRLELVADSPARFAVIEGNIIVDVTGPKRFEKYHTPHIEEACEILHAHGKFAGAHLDDNNKILASAIAKTSLDLIESFTPPPDCNLPLAEARRLWPEKTVQINFPSSLHLQGPEHVRKAAADILKQAAPGNRFIVGVSEDISGRGVKTLVPLAQTIHHLGQTPITTS
jgi:hypothetical protein